MKIKEEIKYDLHIYDEDDSELCRIKLLLKYNNSHKSYELLKQVSYRFIKRGYAHHSMGFTNIFDYIKHPFTLYMTIGNWGCDLNLSNTYINKIPKLIISSLNIDMSNVIIGRNKCQN
jgi:hypothetical protein